VAKTEKPQTLKTGSALPRCGPLMVLFAMGNACGDAEKLVREGGEQKGGGSSRPPLPLHLV
jgi:hypothetical protein